ncbi:MAG: hypothetical protein FJ104_13435, partial [Deltaproteobacteria bacterium]|nr:hypothetical protein [Deltaproteobacteria bacterium]
MRGTAGDATGPAARYEARWFEREAAFDAADRPVRESSGLPPDGARSPFVVRELLGQGKRSEVSTTYTRRGTMARVSGSYGTLVDSVTRTA